MLPDKNELTKRYAKLSNDQLLEILHNKDEYTTEALEAVRDEIGRRNIGTEELETFVLEKKAVAFVNEENARVPLEFWEKLFFFFLSFFTWFVRGALQMNYREDGLHTKTQQSKFFRIAGLISVLLSSVLTAWLNLGNVGFLVLWVAFFGITSWMASRKSTAAEG